MFMQQHLGLDLVIGEGVMLTLIVRVNQFDIAAIEPDHPLGVSDLE